jgi:hypothetical protein
MEGFSMQWSHKRTAGLPNSHPIGLQRHCSFCQALHSLCCARPQPCARPTHGRIPNSLAAPDPCTTGIPAPQLHSGLQPRTGPTPSQDTCPLATPDLSPEPVPQLARIPTHPFPQPTAPWTTPAHQALQGSSSMWNNWSPTQLGQAQAWHETATSTSPPGPPPLGRGQSQLYRLSR